MSASEAGAGPPPSPSSLPHAPADGGRLEQLLVRLRADADFPALSAQVLRVQALAGDERENLHRLAEEILKDVALTQKLLRLVNAAPYVAHRGGVATVSRALSLLGMSAVRGIASSLVLLERWENRAQARRLRETYARSLLAAQLAADLYGQGAEREEVFLAALFQGLGRMLTECFFPEEAQRIRAESQGDPVREQAAVLRHLGASYDELALAVAREWGLPEALRRTMERPAGPVPPRPPQDRVEWVRWLAAAGTDLADAWLRGASEGNGDAFARLARRYGHLVNQPMETVVDTARQARQRFLVIADAVGLVPSLQSSDWVAWLGADQGDPLHPAPVAPAAAGHTIAPPPNEDEAGGRPTPLLILARGLQDASAALLDGSPPALRLALGLETLHRAFGLQRTWLVTPAADGTASARRWLGVGAEAVAPFYRVPLSEGAAEAADLLAALGRLRKDSWIEEPQAARVLVRLPAWYRERLAPRTALLVLPLWRGDDWLGWVHADGPVASLPVFGPAERALLRAQRNLMVMALAAGPRP